MTDASSGITVRAGSRRSERVRIDHGPGGPHEQRLRIVLEPGSSLSLEELHYGLGAGEVSLKIDAELGQGARMRHVAVLDDAGIGSYAIRRQVRIAGEAELHYTRIGCGAAADCETLRASLEGPRARFRHGALLLVEPGRQAGLDLKITHQARETASESLCRAVVGGGGRGRFAGRILIKPDGQGADARLRNDNLLLSDTARMETKPELEVYADEVQCAHGAATGALDEAALFYLKTRGIPARQAREMLVRAFASGVSDAIDMAGARALAGELLSRALNGPGPHRLAA